MSSITVSKAKRIIVMTLVALTVPTLVIALRYSSPAPTTTTTMPTTTTTVASGGIPTVAGWKADFAENFTGTSLNSSMWNVRNDTENSNEDSYLESGNVSVSGGALNITAKDQAAGGRNYTSGYVDSDGKVALPDDFRVQIRAKVPEQMGMWAAPIWFRPANGSGGEIDLVETYGADAPNFDVHQTIHSAYGASEQQTQYKTSFASLGDSTGEAWHTYTIEKVKGQITEWTDNTETAQYTTTNPSWFSTYFDAGNTWNMRINLQVGGARGLPDSTTNWNDTTMSVDYIYAWTQN